MDWINLLRKAVQAEGSQAAVAGRLGYSPATVSRVMSGSYTGDTDKIAARVIEEYGEGQMQQIPEGYIADRQGCLWWKDNVSAIDLLKDDLARAMIGEAEELAESMSAMKRRWLANMQALLQTAAEQYGVTNLEGQTGDFGIASFDGRVKVERVHRKLMVVDTAKAAIAKELVDRVVDRLSHNLPGDVRRAVRAAFRRDEKGNYSATGLTSLMRRIKLPENEEWQQAVAAIADAVGTEYCEPYVRFYVRDKDGKTYRQIQLDLSTVAVAEKTENGE